MYLFYEAFQILNMIQWVTIERLSDLCYQCFPAVRTMWLVTLLYQLSTLLLIHAQNACIGQSTFRSPGQWKQLCSHSHPFHPAAALTSLTPPTQLPFTLFLSAATGCNLISISTVAVWLSEECVWGVTAVGMTELENGAHCWLLELHSYKGSIKTPEVVKVHSTGSICSAARNCSWTCSGCFALIMCHWTNKAAIWLSARDS